MSLRLRRVSSSIRSRVCREFCQSMAAFLGVSALIFLFGTVLNVNLVLTGPLDNRITGDAPETKPLQLMSIPGDPARQDYGKADIIPASLGKDEGSFAMQRHNRVLQFMDTKKYKDREVNDESEYPNSDSQLGDDRNKLSSSFYLEEESSNKNGNKISSHDINPNRLHVSQSGANSQHEEKNIPKPRNLAANSDESQSDEERTRAIKFNDKNRSAVYRNSSEIPIKRLPKAIVIGVKKSGTRALLEFLRMHPDVEGPGPEPHFFDRNYEKGLAWYRELMPRTYSDQITVEKTPGYFITKDVPKRIRHMDSTVKLILVVRDPVTRAISDYCQAASKRPLRPFEEMALLDQRMGLVNTSWGAIKIGVYAKHMERWLQTFPLQQIHLVDGQKLITEPAKELAKVEKFLGLPKFINEKHFYLNVFKGSFPCINRDGRPHCLDERTKGREHPKVKEEVLQRLRDFYRPFNAKFYQMVGRDFGWS